MKKLIYVLIVLLSFISCSKSLVVVNENDLPEDIFYLPEEIRPYTGQCIIYFPGTEVVKEQFTFKKGMLHGTTISYYQCGDLKIKGEYKDGRLYGKWESWYEGGKKKYEVNYVNDTLSGNYMQWYQTGVLKEKGLYAENSRYGAWVEYDEAGMIVKKLKFE
jgi:antitoxin component YwqK of YwqJK toxin-antitoxin module